MCLALLDMLRAEERRGRMRRRRRRSRRERKAVAESRTVIYVLFMCSVTLEVYLYILCLIECLLAFSPRSSQ